MARKEKKGKKTKPVTAVPSVATKEHPSPLVTLQSSHASVFLLLIIPSPHTSKTQTIVHPSPFTALPSSHCSVLLLVMNSRQRDCPSLHLCANPRSWPLAEVGWASCSVCERPIAENVRTRTFARLHENVRTPRTFGENH
jgi:hypothetical protein